MKRHNWIRTFPLDGRWCNRCGPGWHKDIGYQLQAVLGTHQYSANLQSSRLDDPGWHGCSCGEWEGYWSSFHPHVADQLRILVTAACTVDPCREGTH